MDELFFISCDVDYEWMGNKFTHTYSNVVPALAIDKILTNLRKTKAYNIQITKRNPNQKRTIAPDGHYHYIDGKPQNHTWEDCPENPNNRLVAD